jgi:hypothetical protein
MNLLHEPWPCDLGCGEPVAPRYWAEHSSAECPNRKVSCVYCSLQVAAAARAEHEAMCGGRSVPCEMCGRLEARKRMPRHLALAHGIGDVTAFAGMPTPSSPYVMQPPSGAQLAEMGILDLGSGGGSSSGGGGGTAAAPDARPSRASGGGGGGGSGPILRFEDLLERHSSTDDDDDEDYDGGDGGGGGGYGYDVTMAGGGGSGGDESVACPSCARLCASFEKMQLHMLTDCANLGSQKHTDMLQSLSSDATAADAVAVADASAPASSAPATSATLTPAVAPPLPPPVPTQLRRRRWRCPCCSESFAGEDDVQVGSWSSPDMRRTPSLPTLPSAASPPLKPSAILHALLLLRAASPGAHHHGGVLLALGGPRRGPGSDQARHGHRQQRPHSQRQQQHWRWQRFCRPTARCSSATSAAAPCSSCTTSQAFPFPPPR